MSKSVIEYISANLSTVIVLFIMVTNGALT